LKLFTIVALNHLNPIEFIIVLTTESLKSHSIYYRSTHFVERWKSSHFQIKKLGCEKKSFERRKFKSQVSTSLSDCVYSIMQRTNIFENIPLKAKNQFLSWQEKKFGKKCFIQLMEGTLTLWIDKSSHNKLNVIFLFLFTYFSVCTFFYLHQFILVYLLFLSLSLLLSFKSHFFYSVSFFLSIFSLSVFVHLFSFKSILRYSIWQRYWWKKHNLIKNWIFYTLHISKQRS
jgi:hypothetical protein